MSQRGIREQLTHLAHPTSDPQKFEAMGENVDAPIAAISRNKQLGIRMLQVVDTSCGQMCLMVGKLVETQEVPSKL